MEDAPAERETICLKVPSLFSIVVVLLCCLKYRMLPFYISRVGAGGVSKV